MIDEESRICKYSGFVILLTAIMNLEVTFPTDLFPGISRIPNALRVLNT